MESDIHLIFVALLFCKWRKLSVCRAFKLLELVFTQTEAVVTQTQFACNIGIEHPADHSENNTTVMLDDKKSFFSYQQLGNQGVLRR